ncbi:MAG: hypothetical protein DRJ36_01270 [Thermoprotei archaeon]|nr:MAG: hypothetical protein DRJ36_01270 [Thermoprotei archaeon]
MLVYFAPCGMGLGHAARTLAIAGKIVEKGHTAVFSTYGDAVSFLKKQGQKVLVSYELQYEQAKDGSVDLRLTIAKGPRSLYIFARQVAAELYYTGIFEPDIVVSDSRLSSSIAALFRRIPSVLISNQLIVRIPVKRKLNRGLNFAKSLAENVLLEATMNVWRRSSLIIIPDFPPPYTISRHNIVFKEEYSDKTVLVGPLVTKMPEELPPRESLRKSLGIDDRVFVLIVVSGVRGEKEALLQLFKKVLSNISLSDDYYIIVTAGFAERVEEVEYIRDNVAIYYWLSNKFEYLKAADVLVSHGGHTTLAEGMYYGVPQIIVPSISHTERVGNARSLESLGIGILLPQENLTAKSFEEALEKIYKSEDYRRRAREISEEVCRIRAAERAAELIIKAANEEPIS